MARELITKLWCDRCMGYGNEQGEHNEPATHESITITIQEGVDRPLTRVLDLCDSHFKEYVDPLADLMVEEGTKPEHIPTGPPKTRSSKEAGPFRCKVPDCTSKPLANRGSFNAHVRQQHGMLIGEYKATYGDLVPEGSASAEEPSQGSKDTRQGDERVECPECGKVYSFELGNNRPNQALGVHLARTHGIRSPKVTGEEATS